MVLGVNDTVWKRTSRLFFVAALALSCGSEDPQKDDASGGDPPPEETGAPVEDTAPVDTAQPPADTGDDPPVDTSSPDDAGVVPDTAEEPDLDGDGFTIAMGDCDDTDFRINPEGREVCNLKDDDCDGEIDEDAWDAGTFFMDADSDGYGDASAVTRACVVPSGHVTDSTDCDDSAVETYPGADETCDEVDNDCDGEVDEDAIDPRAWYVDRDGDRFGDASIVAYACDPIPGMVETGSDCNDSDDTVHPDAVEYCDEIDNDCDGEVDTDADFGLRTWYADDDGDGHGTVLETTESCAPPSGYVWTSDDCDDTKAARYPGATESCDLLDNDCDEVVDEEGVCLSCDVDYPTPLTVFDAGTGGGDVDAGSAECYISGYDYECDDCGAVTLPIGADGEVTGAYNTLSWVVTSGSASIADSSSLSTTVTLSGLSPTEPDECEEESATVELRVEDCDGTMYTESISFTLTCCGTG